MMSAGAVTRNQKPGFLKKLGLLTRAALQPEFAAVSNTKRIIRVGHSPDPDDAFMFHALANGKLDTGRYVFTHTLQDIETLNQRAFKGELELTAVSMEAFGALNRLLGDMSNRLAPVVPLPDGVVNFRTWLVEEITAQASGAPPAVCPLPAE